MSEFDTPPRSDPKPADSERPAAAKSVRCVDCGTLNSTDATVCTSCDAPLPLAKPKFALGGSDPLAAIIDAEVLRSRSRPNTVQMQAPPDLSDIHSIPAPEVVPAPPPPERQSTVRPTMELESYPEPDDSDPKTQELPAARQRRTTAVPSVHALTDVPPPPTTEVDVSKSAPPTPRRHAHLTRVLPLGIIAGIVVGGAAVVLISTMKNTNVSDSEANSAVIVDAAEERVLALPAVDATIGMTNDNKETWLTTCFRVADNASVECRLSYLTEAGEYPAQIVPMPALEADAFEVSNALYERCVAAGGCEIRDRDACRFRTQRGFELGVDVPNSFFAAGHPAVCATYEQAVALCEWRDMRLPTPQEWERLARADGTGLFPWRGNFWAPGLMNWGERDMTGFPIPGRLDGAEYTARVDAFEDGTTSEGLHHTLGNVAEWVTPSDRDAGEGHAGIRGGSYTDDIRTLRTTHHDSMPRSQRRSDVGFRCVAE